MTSSPAPPTWSPWGREYARSGDHYVFGTGPSDFALEVAGLVRPGDRVLDLGSGEGRDAVFFAERGAVVTGVELSSAGIAKARRLARSRHAHVTWMEGTMTGPLPAGRFDLIFSCGSVHYVARPARIELFRRLEEMTRPGGYQAHLAFTDRLIHEEKGEVVDYFSEGELRETFGSWRRVVYGQYTIDCTQDGTIHRHAVEELIAERPAA